MRTALLLLLLAPCQSTEGPVTRALLFLARHQGKDGSWGLPPATCRCRPRISVDTPLPIPIDPVVAARYERLAAQLADDAISIRERAQREIQSLGARAVPLLQRSIDHEDPEVAHRCREALREIWSNDPAIRTLCVGLGWAPDEEYHVMATSLGLLTFLQAGYTTLSRDEHSDSSGRYVYGDVVRNAAKWLLSRQGADGSFAPRTPVVHAIATTVLSELYGMTAAAVLLEPATKAAASLKTMRSSDGAFLVWKGIALYSARLSEIADCDKTVCDQMSDLPASESTPAAVSAALLLSTCSKRDTERLRLRFAELDPKELTPLDEWLVTAAALRCGNDAVRTRWRSRLSQRLPEFQASGNGCESGSWETQGELWHQNLVRTMYATLTMERFYGYKYTLFWSPWTN